jgi:hypothetical protein
MKTPAQIFRRLRCERGITLVEMLVAAAMTVAITVAALPVIDSAGCHEPQVSNKAAGIERARWFVERMKRDLRNTITYSGSVTSTSVTVNTYTRHNPCGSTTVEAPDLEPNICKLTYSCAGGTCTRQEQDVPGGPGNVGPVVTVVSGLADNNVFSYGPYGVWIVLNVRMSNPSGPGGDAVTLQDAVQLRDLLL